MIEKVISAMMAKDYKAMAACFAPKCRYFDYSPLSLNMQTYHVYSRPSIEMFFHNKFTFRVINVFDYVIEDERTANYLVAYAGTYMCVRARIERLDENGLIQDMTVRMA
ncbi:MAG: hypothetical protein LIO42_00445 [Oscillospiraceae bacterium]|nr:hypothetical protein [Oscillospiraceae bacterium]